MRNRIDINPAIHFGKPCVAGTRIPVQSVLEVVREGIPFDQIVRDYYPDLTIEDIQAIHQELKVVLNLHSEQVLQKAFVVIEPGRHRFRKIKQ